MTPPLPKGHSPQIQPMTVALRNICRDYPAGGAILRELLQNADDAGASNVVCRLALPLHCNFVFHSFLSDSADSIYRDSSSIRTATQRTIFFTPILLSIKVLHFWHITVLSSRPRILSLSREWGIPESFKMATRLVNLEEGSIR